MCDFIPCLFLVRKVISCGNAGLEAPRAKKEFVFKKSGVHTDSKFWVWFWPNKMLIINALLHQSSVSSYINVRSDNVHFLTVRNFRRFWVYLSCSISLAAIGRIWADRVSLYTASVFCHIRDLAIIFQRQKSYLCSWKRSWISFPVRFEEAFTWTLFHTGVRLRFPFKRMKLPSLTAADCNERKRLCSLLVIG